MTETHSQWRIDKNIPMALIITLLMAFIGQTYLMGKWVAEQEAKVKAAETTVASLKVDGTKRDAAISEIKQAASESNARLVRMETMLEFLVSKKNSTQLEEF